MTGPPRRSTRRSCLRARPTSPFGIPSALLVLAVAAIIQADHHVPAVNAQEADPHSAAVGPDARTVFDGMSSAERVGQVFMIAFLGDETTADSDIAAFITDLHVGGVVLQASSGNITNVPGRGGPGSVAEFTAALQSLAFGSSGNVRQPVPLFIAVDHEGDGAPLTHLREGFTPLPSAMAIGATWEPENARAVGAIVGRELAAVGVNMLLGPVLDVLAEPRTTQRGDIGTRSLGGDPYWVAQMGAAYISGVHEGAAGRVATVAKHFPGHGASDRLPDTEVATVSKSLRELRRIELPPFETVARGAPGSRPDVTDGLMTSHIRYRGFQGNIRNTTPPISLDAEALEAVFGLEGSPLGEWRRGGGLTVADSLGVRALRRYDDPSLDTFHHRDVARRALMAGNDVLILAEFASRNVWRLQRANISDTLTYFNEEYARDRAFARRVDDAALRVLQRKAALYPDGWSLEGVQADPEGAATATGTTESAEVAARVARAAVTVLRRVEPEGPAPEERIVIITDDEGTLSCRHERCGLGGRWERLRDLGPTLVTATILDRYGSPGAGRLQAGMITDITFCQLQAALLPPELSSGDEAEGDPLPEPESDQPRSAPTPGADADACPAGDPAATLTALREAHWIIFAFSELNPEVIRGGDVVENFLHVAGGLVRARTTRLAALSFGPPYPFETTDFNKFDVFIAAYSKIPVSVDAALEAFFGEYVPSGAPPVTVEGANYDLAFVVEPNMETPLEVRLRNPEAIRGADLPARYEVEAGPVTDHNGNAVPDGTVIEFRQEDASGDRAGEPTFAGTTAGLARATLSSSRGGRITVRASFAGTDWPARLVVDLPVPTPAPPPSPQPTQLPIPPPPAEAASVPRLSVADLLLCMASIVVVSAAWVASPGWRRRPPDSQLRTVLFTAAGGLAAYLLYGAMLEVAFGARLLGGAAHGDAALSGLIGALGASGLMASRWARLKVR